MTHGVTCIGPRVGLNLYESLSMQNILRFCHDVYSMAHIAHSVPWQGMIYFTGNRKNTWFDIDSLCKCLPNKIILIMEGENTGNLLNPDTPFSRRLSPRNAIILNIDIDASAY